MRMMPSIFGEDLFDEWMDFPFEKEFFGRKNPLYGKNEKNLMKTDVKETEDSFEIDIDLPGFKKENVTARLENGYLTIQASKGLDKDKEDKEGKYIRRERYAGSCSRSFYIGEGVTQDEIRARFEDGILRLTVPKKDKKQVKKINISPLKDKLLCYPSFEDRRFVCKRRSFLACRETDSSSLQDLSLCAMVREKTGDILG